jgi:trans-aconitate methyltransferase
VRANRFVFAEIVDDYVAGRPDMPSDAVADAARALGLERGERVLEIGGGTGQLTWALVAAGFDIVSLEPAGRMRARLAARVPAASVRDETFEELEPDERYAAVFASNAFHWVDPQVGLAKVAEVADGLVLIWDMPLPADEGLFRRVQDEVLAPRGSTFPNSHAAVRALFDADNAERRRVLAESGLFEDPWWRTYERRLEYTPARYTSLVLSMSHIAAEGREFGADLARDLLGVLPREPFRLLDWVYACAARVKGA